MFYTTTSYVISSWRDDNNFRGKKPAGADNLLQYKKPVLHAAGVLSKKGSEKTNIMQHRAFLIKKLSNIISMALGQFKILSHF